MKVLVIAGGKSAERDVSLSSGDAVSRGLLAAGAEVSFLDPGVMPHPGPFDPSRPTAAIGAIPPDAAALKKQKHGTSTRLSPADIPFSDLNSVDVVFIALHGGDGEDGHLQALLDMAGVPYTGSGMLASAVAMDKDAAKRIFAAEGIPTPRWQMIASPGEADFAEAEETFGLPFVVKPNAQGSTVGLTVVRDPVHWDAALAEAFRWDGRVMIEEYIPGREITVGILDREPLPVIEIKPKHGVYDYECKYTPGQTEYVCPAPLTAAQARAAQEQGWDAYRALGCRGFGRADFRMAADGRLYCLEVNTLPGMTATSLVPKAARVAGIEFPELVTRICRVALAR